MENTLGLYKLTNAGAVEFPSADNWAKLGDYKYSATRMGTVPSITATLIWPTCLDELWDDDVFVEFRGEKYFLKDTPSSSRDNTKCTYSHNVEFVSERTILSEVYFFDAVKNSDSDIVSDNSEFSFSGDINVFAEKINASMNRSGIGANNSGYYVVVDEGMTSESELFQSSNQFIYDALKAAYELYEIPFYFVGKTIHFGNYQTKIETPIEYGSKSSALSISKNNKNKRIVNRITGVGSDRNLKYYYPNPTPKGYISLYDESDGLVSITDFAKFASNMPVDTEFKFDRGLVNNGSLYSPHVVYKIGSNGFGGELEVDENREYTAYIRGNGEYDNDRYYIDYPLGFLDPGDYKFRLKVLPKTLQVGATANFAYKVSVSSQDVKTTRVDDMTLVLHLDDRLYASDLSFEVYFVPASGTQPPFEAVFGLPKLYPLELDSFKLINVPNGKETEISDLGLSVSGEIPPHGTKIKQIIDKRVNVQNNLMPPKYRDTDGSERFYDAMNNLYKDEDGEYYEFSNPYTPVRPREYIYTDEEIYPSITGIVNASGQRIDMVAEVAFDMWDDNEIYPEDYKDQKLAKTYKHPYFFVKLRKTDGENGFNLFDSAIDGETMKISFTSGHVASCEFEIGVDEDSGKNTVQVDSDGNLVIDKDGNVVYRGVAQDVQQNTMTNEVWIALKKEESTMGVLMPDTKQFIQPTVDDTFVILGIDLPDAYVLAAEKRLERAILDYMRDNNSREFTYSVKLSSIYLAENKLLYESLNENSMVGLVYDSNNEGDFFVDSYSYSVNQKAALPEISITLNNEIKLVVPKSKAVNDAIQNITTTSIKAVTETDNLKARTQSLEAKVSKIEDVNIAEDINNIKTDLEHIDERVSDLEKSGGGGGGSSINIESSGPAYIEVQSDGTGGYTISPNIMPIDEVDTVQDAHGIADSADVKEHLESLKEWVNAEVEFVMYTPSNDIDEDTLLVYDSSKSSVKSSGVKVSDDDKDLYSEDNTKVPTCATISRFVGDFVDEAQTDIRNRVINGKGNVKTSRVCIVSGIIEDDSIIYALPSAPEQSLGDADHIIATNSYVDSKFYIIPGITIYDIDAAIDNGEDDFSPLTDSLYDRFGEAVSDNKMIYIKVEDGLDGYVPVSVFQDDFIYVDFVHEGFMYSIDFEGSYTTTIERKKLVTDDVIGDINTLLETIIAG